MQLGVVGLGRMGGNIVRRLMRKGHRLRRLRPQARGGRGSSPGEGATRGRDLDELVGQARSAARGLGDAAGGRDHRADGARRSRSLLEPGDIVIDGGNTFYRDDIRRAKALRRTAARLCRRRHVAAASGGWSAATA